MQTTNTLFNDIKTFSDTYHLLPDNSKIIIGLSGGPDSVLLLYFLKSIAAEKQLTLIAAHLDHEWRTDSYQDAEFCQALCVRLNIQLFIEKSSALPLLLKSNGSQEEIGRRMRRFYFKSLLEQEKADLIALGHHAQDQQETFFIRLIRGTTLSGLVGMKPRDNVFIRPLLETNKADIIHYLNTHHIDYLLDPTNVAESFLRNRIRKFVLPALQTSDQRFDVNFLRTLHSLQQTEQFLEEITYQAFITIAKLSNNTWHLDFEQLLRYNTVLQKRILMHWLITEQVPFTPSEKLLAEIDRFLHNKKSNRHQLYQSWGIIKDRNTIYISEL